MKNILTILFIGISLFSYSQNSIKGKITDKNNIPISDVDIYISDLQKGTTSNNNGEYELKNVPNGYLKITCSFIGYETQVKEIYSVTNNTNLDFVLEEAVFKMDEVIVSTPFNKLQSQNVMKIEHENIKTLQKKGNATLMEGVSSIPGVSQITTGLGIGKPVIRGLSGNRVLVYSQGIRLENQQFGDEHGLGLNSAAIESVEVIKGPASLLYGSDALGGVLYFNPEKFASINSLALDASHQYFSNTKGYSSSLGFKKSFNHFKFLTRFNYASHSDYKIPDKNRVTNTRFNELDYTTGIGYSNATISSTLRYNFNKSNIGIPEEIGLQTTTKKLELPYQDLTNQTVSFLNTFFLQNSKIETTLGYISNDRKEFEEHHHHDEIETHTDEDMHETMAPSLHMKLSTYTYDLKWNLPKSNKFESIIGFQGLTQNNKNLGEEILIPDATTIDLGVFATGLYQWKENALQGGIRFDKRLINTAKHSIQHEDEVHVFEPLNKTFKSVTASVGLKSDLLNNFTTRVNIATGFKAPNLAELTSNGVHHGSNRFEKGNSNLTKEQNIQTDISIEYQNKHIEFFVNGFYNFINDYIFISPTGETEDGNAVFKYIQDDAKLYGGEIGFHLHPHPLDWLHIESNFETVVGKQDNSFYLPLIPPSKLNTTIRAEFNSKKWLNQGYTSITLQNTFKQSKISQFETPSNSYNLLNLNVGGNIVLNKTNFDINFNINNVLNTKYIAHLSRLKTANIPNIGRNFVISLKWNLN